MTHTLEENLTGYVASGGKFPDIPEHIRENLNRLFDLRPYQIEAFGRMLHYFQNAKLCKKPSQLLFHMATGSGKTLIMAGAILHFYSLGYRKFLFFVNSTNIIEKTRDNFLNPGSSKYLFARNLNFGGKMVNVREVENFQYGNSDDINIVFTTIQGLHDTLNEPKENAVTYGDFAGQKVVLISDEAHHINVATKNGDANNVSWESTVNRIFNSNRDNVMLEFTATVDLSDKAIADKYSGKIIYDYPLKQFRGDGYSKEVYVLETDASPMKMALQAIVLSQYRRKMFERHKKAIKPVVLFKSNTIKESKKFHAEFIDFVRSLSVKDLRSLPKNFKSRFKDSESPVEKCLKYFAEQKIALENLIEELKIDFAADKCLEINSEGVSKTEQIAVNTLEDLSNNYRAIFAVNQLNEGWDVLNLFDIVRLNDKHKCDSVVKVRKPDKTTIAEAQLIGRGARYCPFQLDASQPKYMRKYDKDLDNELRMCEVMYYHSYKNPQYIQDLHKALQETGMEDANRKEISLSLKAAFKQTNVFKKGYLFLNERTSEYSKGLFALPKDISEKTYHCSLSTGAASVTPIFDKDASDSPHISSRKDYPLASFGIPVIRKAMAKQEAFRFDRLQALLPNVTSVREFITSDSYLGKIKVEVSGGQESLDNMSQDEKLKVAMTVLADVAASLQSQKDKCYGTTLFKPKRVNELFEETKTVSISCDEHGTQERGIPQSKAKNVDLQIDLSKKDWYAFDENYGTSEEKRLVVYIDKIYEKLKDSYSEIYLLRNEGHFGLYAFADGRRVEPDFVLLLKNGKNGKIVNYQIFIEPKGEQLMAEDAWKEEFLMSIKGKSQIDRILENEDYTVWGMPFYNEAKEYKFNDEFKKFFGT